MKSIFYITTVIILIPEIGDVGQEKFNNATVMIIGLGGLGCPVARLSCGFWNRTNWIM